MCVPRPSSAQIQNGSYVTTERRRTDRRSVLRTVIECTLAQLKIDHALLCPLTEQVQYNDCTVLPQSGAAIRPVTSLDSCDQDS
jgi:hypothetical protein